MIARITAQRLLGELTRPGRVTGLQQGPGTVVVLPDHVEGREVAVGELHAQPLIGTLHGGVVDDEPCSKVWSVGNGLEEDA